MIALDIHDTDEKLRDAITIAEQRYDDPAIVIVANPGIASRLRDYMGAPVRASNIRINGYDIFESERASLHVLVCGEQHSSNSVFADLDRNT
jgi:hypothetical protein